MKSIKYVPKDCQGESATFSGHIELRLPLFEERLAYLEILGVTVNDEGEVDTGKAVKNGLKSLLAMMHIAKPHYIAVALKHLKSGAEYSCYEDLSCDPECQGIISEIAAAIPNSLKPGNA